MAALIPDIQLRNGSEMPMWVVPTVAKNFLGNKRFRAADVLQIAK